MKKILLVILILGMFSVGGESLAKRKRRSPASSKRSKPVPTNVEVVKEEKNVPEKKDKPLPEYSAGQISFEVLGQAYIYSVFGSYRPFRFLAVNAGVSYLNFDKVFVTEIPLSVSGLIGKKNSYLEILAGATINLGSRLNSGATPSAKFSGDRAVAVAGIGYRYWPNEPHFFHFRGTIYGFFTDNYFLVWSGLSLGFTI